MADALVSAWQKRLNAVGYVADDSVAAAVYLSLSLKRPLLVEGPAGVGKTLLAKTLAQILERPLIRLQCYEGLDDTKALYDWNYPKQLLMARSANGTEFSADSVYTWEYLLERPLLKALSMEPAPVLLIDEVERADEEFEAMLLEFLGEFQLSIPELGTVTAKERPVVVLTSNRSRDLSDALRRRCLYLWLDYPDVDREVDILLHTLPELRDHMARGVALAAGTLRSWNLMKPPGIAESLDWARALTSFGDAPVSQKTLSWTLGAVLKTREDWSVVLHQGMERLWPS